MSKIKISFVTVLWLFVISMSFSIYYSSKKANNQIRIYNLQTMSSTIKSIKHDLCLLVDKLQQKERSGFNVTAQDLDWKDFKAKLGTYKVEVAKYNYEAQFVPDFDLEKNNLSKSLYPIIECSDFEIK